MRLKRVAARAWRAESQRRAAQAKAELTIYVTTDSEIRLLNRKFHGTNAATDVLSFPLRWGDAEGRPYMGDIVISYDRARVQARQAGWKIGDELDLLVVHGVLHLLGYDDLTPRGRARMWKKQEQVLGKINH